MPHFGILDDLSKFHRNQTIEGGLKNLDDKNWQNNLPTHILPYPIYEKGMHVKKLPLSVIKDSKIPTENLNFPDFIMHSIFVQYGLANADKNGYQTKDKGPRLSCDRDVAEIDNRKFFVNNT